MIKNLINHWEAMTGVVGIVVAYFSGRRIKRIEEKKASSDAVSSMQLVYDNFVKDIEQRYVDMKQEMQSLKDEVQQLRIENDKLRKELRTWEKKYYSLKDEYENRL
jgi:regulator of replication initiation timing